MEKEEDLIGLLKEIGCPENVITHIIAVKEVALRIAGELKIPLDKDLLRRGVLLHDIGRIKTHGLDHAVVGANIARDMGIDERAIRIIERHIGAGITKDEASSLGLPEKDYLPETPEEKIVAYADNLINGNFEVSFEESLERFKKVLGKDHPSIQRYIKFHQEIEGWKKIQTIR